MPLQNEIDAARKDIRTDRYSVSIGEWISIYEKGELDIHPEFQRFFRWTPNQKSRLIESIFLGIPIPQIFVAQRADGVWDVVDGLQRLSTIYQFAGILRSEDRALVNPLVLEPTRYLPSLAGYKWDDPDDPAHSLDTAQRLLIKRAKIDVSIILRESEERAKYELFQRLNTGGSMLSDQEVRNAILVMVNREFYQWIRELSDYVPFVESTALSDRAVEEQYDMELVLRFLVFRKMEPSELRGLGDFLTDTAAELAQRNDPNRVEEERAFKTTFDILSEHLGADAFRRYDREHDRFVGGFSVSAFEAVALGLGYHFGRTHLGNGGLREKVKRLWSAPEFVDNSGSGHSRLNQNSRNRPLWEETVSSVSIRTQEQLFDHLSGDLIWRKKEISTVKSLLAGARSDRRDALLRAGVTLLYAHWEGFVKVAGNAYLEFLHYRRLRYADLSVNLLTFAARGLLRKASSSLRFGVHLEVTEFFLKRLNDQSILPYKAGIGTGSNLSSDLFREIVQILGLQLAPFETKTQLIDERLLRTRNTIAHGEYLTVDEAAFVELADEVVAMLENFRTQIDNVVALEQYKV